MNLRKSLIQLAKKMELVWQAVDFTKHPVLIRKGWYVAEFLLKGSLRRTPRIIVDQPDSSPVERKLTGFHSGRNRMLIYLPDGQLTAYSESIDFSCLSRVPSWEGRLRVLLICGRYLINFPNPLVLLRMFFMQFKNPFDLSTELLYFYASPDDSVEYLRDLQSWNYVRPFRKQMAWYYRRTRIAVLIEDDSQREKLNEMLVAPDAILLVGAVSEIPSDIDYVIPLAITERLRDPSMLVLKRAINKAIGIRRGPAPRLVYTDHDYTVEDSDDDSPMEPVFKPSPSAAYLHCYNYPGPSLMFAREVVAGVELPALFSVDQQYAMALREFENIETVLHLDDVLFVSDQREGRMLTPAPVSDISPWPDISWQRRGDHNVLVANENWNNKPAVDLIIPTRDGLSVLKPCIESILQKTDYPQYRIIIVDNGSELDETHVFFAEAMKDERVIVVEYPGEFNYSAINNFGVAQGSSDYLALINNDIEVIHADWLSQMMVWAKQPNVGVVGAKLLYGNGLIQHAGVTIGMGNAAGHIHRLEEGDSPGYQNRCVATQNMMAVTAACLVTRRKIFEELGGLDEKNLKVAYNDIDYCLRVEQRGLEVIWTPEARLFHHESVSRGDDMSDRHISRYFSELRILQKRWKTKGFVDKYYSRHLRIGDEGVYPQVSVKGVDRLHYLEQ